MNPVSWKTQSGGVTSRILWLVLTLCIVGAGIFFLIHRLQTDQQRCHRKAGEISDYALLQTMAALQKNPSQSTGIEKAPYDGGWYSVGLTRESRSDTLFISIEANGTMGSFVQKRSCVVKLVVAGTDSTWQVVRQRQTEL